jgi:ribonuclease HI
MNKAVEPARLWAKDFGLELCPDKTKGMIFTRKTCLKGQGTLLLGGKEIEIVQSIKYLGVHLDSKLTWATHVDSKVLAAKKTIYMLRSTIGATWGLKPAVIHWIYTAVVRPMMTYAIGLWGTFLSKNLVAKLASVQRMALMQMGNCRKGTPTEGLNVITGTLPMELWIEQQVLNVQVRLQSHIPNEDWAKNPLCHLGRGKILLDQLDLNTLSLDNYVKDLIFTQNYKVDTESFTYGDDAYDQNKYNCYTDGSKFKNQTGQGGIIYYPGQHPAQYGTWSKRGHNQNTVFQMEVEAIRYAAMALKSLWVDKPEGPNVATIFVDNQASLKALNKYEIASTETHDAKTALNEAGLLGSITLRWIKAHVGYPGNEEADILAKGGSQLSCEIKKLWRN